MIPTFEYQDADGNPVKSTSDPNWKYTIINGTVRTVKDGDPQQLVAGVWRNIKEVQAEATAAAKASQKLAQANQSEQQVLNLIR